MAKNNYSGLSKKLWPPSTTKNGHQYYISNDFWNTNILITPSPSHRRNIIFSACTCMSERKSCKKRWLISAYPEVTITMKVGGAVGIPVLTQKEIWLRMEDWAAVIKCILIRSSFIYFWLLKVIVLIRQNKNEEWN